MSTSITFKFFCPVLAEKTAKPVGHVFIYGKMAAQVKKNDTRRFGENGPINRGRNRLFFLPKRDADMPRRHFSYFLFR